MALIEYPECFEQVSDKAGKCPHCGARIRKLRRGIFGTLIKWLFILFNVLMLIWVIGGIGVTNDAISSAKNSAEAAGAAVGSGLGMMMLLMLWCIGDIILAILLFLTRPKD